MTFPAFLGASSDEAGTPHRVSSRAAAARWVVVQRDTEEAPDAADVALLDGLRAGDEGAFRSLWDQHHVRLAAFAYRYLHSRDAAADVVQDVFISLWERHAEINVRGSLAGYLYSMVRYTVMDALKHDRVVRRHSETLAATYASAPVVARNLGADATEVEALQQLVRHVVAALPPRTREIFLLSREDGLAPAAIASVLGIAPQVVYNQLSRALKALHEAIARVG